MTNTNAVSDFDLTTHSAHLCRLLPGNPKDFLTRKAKVPPPWPYSVYFSINQQHHEVKVLAISGTAAGIPPHFADG
jgi:hypothetical protein